VDHQAASDAVRDTGMSGAVAQSIASATSHISIFEHVAVLVVGLWGTYFAAVGLIKTLSRVSAAAWRIPRPKLRGRTRLVGIVLVLLIALVGLSSAWTRLRAGTNPLEFAVFYVVFALAYATVIVLLHVHLPRPDETHWSTLIPGGLLIGVALATMQVVVLAFLARKVAASSQLYGGIGTAIAILFWLYIQGRLLVLGPLLDVVLWRRRQPHHDVRTDPAAPPGDGAVPTHRRDRRQGWSGGAPI